MSESIEIGGRLLKLIIGDVTDLEVDAFVFYARHDLQLGSGFGTAIAVRGGPKIQEEVSRLGPLKTTEAVVSGAGEMKAGHIIHAVGPRFQEEDTENKLRVTVVNALKAAESEQIKRLAFPAMGVGFYGVPLSVCAKVMISAIADYLSGDTTIEEVTISALDKREFLPFQSVLNGLRSSVKEAI